MSSTASYYRDEAGVHLNLHLTGQQYDAVMALLVDSSRSMEIEEVYLLIATAQVREETKDTGPGGARDIMARFNDAPPVGDR